MNIKLSFWWVGWLPAPLPGDPVTLHTLNPWRTLLPSSVDLWHFALGTGVTRPPSQSKGKEPYSKRHFPLRPWGFLHLQHISLVCNYPVQGGGCTPGRWVHIYVYTYSYKKNGFGVEMLHPTESVVPSRPSIPAARVKLPEGCPQPLAQGVVVVCSCILFFSALFCACTAQHTPTQRGGAVAALCPCEAWAPSHLAAAPGMGSSVGPEGDAGCSALAPHPTRCSLGPSVLAQPQAG